MQAGVHGVVLSNVRRYVHVARTPNRSNVITTMRAVVRHEEESPRHTGAKSAMSFIQERYRSVASVSMSSNVHRRHNVRTPVVACNIQ